LFWGVIFCENFKFENLGKIVRKPPGFAEAEKPPLPHHPSLLLEPLAFAIL
jgi:hypothetical protein